MSHLVDAANGPLITLERLMPDDDTRLRWIADDKRIWRFNAAHDATTNSGMAEWMRDALDGCDEGRQETFVIRDNSLGVAAGSSRIGSIDRRAGSCETGWTFFGTGWWGSAVNTAAKLAMLAHAFRDETRHRVFFHVDAPNRRSARAMRKLGVRLEGIIRFDRECHDGHVRSTLVFSLLRDEWPATRKRLEDRLRRLQHPTESRTREALRRAIADRRYSVVPVDRQVTHDLRHALLRPTQDQAVVDYPEDTSLPCRHLALITLGRCVGVLSLYEEGHDRVTAANPWRLRGMAVAEHLQRLGLGGRLMLAAKRLADAHGVDRIWCNAREPSFGFYERWHFSPQGEPFWCATGQRHKLMVCKMTRRDDHVDQSGEGRRHDDANNR